MPFGPAGRPTRRSGKRTCSSAAIDLGRCRHRRTGPGSRVVEDGSSRNESWTPIPLLGLLGHLSLGCRHAGRIYAKRRAGNIVEAQTVTEGDGPRVAAVLAAD